jgi:hypothetical protein
MILTNICNKLSITLNSTKKVKQFEDGLRYKVQKLRINWTLLNIFFFCISYLKYKNNPPNIVQNKMKVRSLARSESWSWIFFMSFTTMVDWLKEWIALSLFSFLKLRCLLKLWDYRPISLVGCIFKVLTKISANRLNKVGGSVICVINRRLYKIDIFRWDIDC